MRAHAIKRTKNGQNGHDKGRDAQKRVPTAGRVEDDRGTLDNFDLIAQGKTPGGDASRGAETVESYAAAGATWWLEDIQPTYFGDDWQSTWTLEAIRERVTHGPPR